MEEVDQRISLTAGGNAASANSSLTRATRWEINYEQSPAEDPSAHTDDHRTDLSVAWIGAPDPLDPGIDHLITKLAGRDEVQAEATWTRCSAHHDKETSMSVITI